MIRTVSGTELDAEISRLTTGPSPGVDERLTGYEEACGRLLHLMRQHIGMKVAWISEFVGLDQVFRLVDVAPGGRGPQVGSATPLNDAYCSRVLAGTMPALVPNVRDDPTAIWLDVTFAMQIGSYLGVPLHGLDGTPQGMLCAISDVPAPHLDERDLVTTRLVAQVIDELTHRALGEGQARRERAALRTHVRRVCAGRGRRSVLQPIVDLGTGEATCAEGLTRFSDVSRTPSAWFAAAYSVGLGPELETAAARAALSHLEAEHPPAAVAVNLSPEVAQHHLDTVLEGVDSRRVVVELTEYAPVTDYEALAAALAAHRSAGLRIAVDDAGAGYASMNHVLRLHPDIVKIDMALVRDIDTDPVRQALVGALVHFSAAVGSVVVAEGVETVAELETLIGLGVPQAQGYLFGLPSEHPVLHGHPHGGPGGVLVDRDAAPDGHLRGA